MKDGLPRTAEKWTGFLVVLIGAALVLLWQLETPAMVAGRRPMVEGINLLAILCFAFSAAACWLGLRGRLSRSGMAAMVCSGGALFIALFSLGFHLFSGASAAEGWRLGPVEARALPVGSSSAVVLLNASLLLLRGTASLSRAFAAALLATVTTLLGLYGVGGGVLVALGVTAFAPSMAMWSGALFVVLGSSCLYRVWRMARLHSPIPRSVLAGFLVGLALLVALSMISYRTIWNFHETTRWLQHRQQVLATIHAVFSDTVDTQTAVQSLTIAGDEDSLLFYRDGVSRLEVDQAQLRALVAEDSGAVSQLERLEKLIQERLAFNRAVMDLYWSQGTPAATALIAGGEGRRKMEQIRAAVSQLENDYRAPIAEREVEARQLATGMYVILPTGTILVLGLLLGGLYLLGREVGERRRAEIALRDSERQFRTMVDAISQLAWMADGNGEVYWYNQRWLDYTGTTLEQMLRFGWRPVHKPETLAKVVAQWNASLASGEPFEMTFPLRGADGNYRWFLTRAFPLADSRGKVQRWCGTNTDVTDLRNAREEIERLNRDLEQRVLDRTAQLKAANEELEAFSYSVSHDLRAPLRAVDGFSHAVIEDYGDLLPAEGQRYLQTIRQGAQHMAHLIDDLLTFSRLSRAPLRRQTVDMDTLVRGVLHDLEIENPGRTIEIDLRPLPWAHADPQLLKQVWINLLSNAFKYTRRREVARIEIGTEQGPPSVGTIYYVRDNGAGFDMRYADKLFGVFRRLHRAEDYEGTGVGLALVQRILRRHSGSVWAEAAVDEGATFSFTIQPVP